MFERFRAMLPLFAIASALVLVAADASAAPRFNAGSRGSRTYSAPPPTAASPNAARPVERSMTNPNQPTSSLASPSSPAAQPGFFNRTGLLGGLLGAGLIGLLLGHGFTGGLAGFASIIGLMLQIGLVALIAMLGWSWWQRRSQSSPAYAGGPALGNLSAQPGSHGSQPRPGMFNGFGGALNGAPIEIKPADYDAFERTLGEVQAAYSNEDLGALRMRVTPEMLSYYAEELAANASRGVVNKISDVKLLQGDLAEAWREGDDDYATVAMRYRQVDKTIDRTSGRVIQGGDTPDEGVEYWTFRRAHGEREPWLVSAIQQAN
jgi:predicted lipid-binding transport protein (Tim44 family)